MEELFKTIMGEYIPSEMTEWLKEQGFFEKPASIYHHGNCTGGLFVHCNEVMNVLLDMTEKMNIKWKNPRSPYIVGMFHDLCKVDDYIEHNSDDYTELQWTHNFNRQPGHGDKSIKLLSQFIELTEEEMLCIRYHMGAYNTEDWDGYGEAIKKYETVLWTHHADMYASKVMGV